MANTQKLCDLLAAKVTCSVALGKLYLLKNNYIEDRVYKKIYKAIDALEASIDGLDKKIELEKSNMWEDVKANYEAELQKKKYEVQISKKDN
jgi:hypothetical protein